MGKLINRYENNGLDNISEMSMDEFKTKTLDASCQTDKE